MIERRRIAEPRTTYDGIESRHDDGIAVYVWGARLKDVIGWAAILAVVVPLAIVASVVVVSHLEWVAVGATVLAALLAVSWAMARAMDGDGFGWRIRVERRPVADAAGGEETA